MTKGKLLITEYEDALVSLLLDEDGKTVSINAETENKRSMVGNIYAANVTDIIPGIGGAFAEFEKGRKGFLHLDGAEEPIFVNSGRNAGPLRSGDIILAQAAGDPVKQKETSFTARISIPGKYAVITPQEPGIRFSSKIKDEDFKNNLIGEASALKDNIGSHDLPEPGFIIRTAAAGADISLILRDMEMLLNIWSGILDKVKNSGRGIIYRAPEFYISDIIDNMSGIEKIVTDDAGCTRAIRTFLEENYPEDAGRLEALNSLKAPLKVLYDVSHRMDEALKKTVWLRSGAFLVIEHTEALTVIDVNSGSASGQDFLKLNLEAAREAARQMRLRNISGMIVIDFISMKKAEDNRTLIREMRDLLKADPQKPAVVDLTKLGLLELTRKKVRRPLYEIIDFC